MAVNGVTFDEQLIQSGDMAHMYWVLCGRKDGVTKGCEVSYSGKNIYVAAGYFLAHGRLTKMSSTTTVQVPSVSEGTTYCRLVYDIDLTKTNTESSFTQGEFKIITSTTAYPTPTQEDLDNGGTHYQLPFARFTLTSGGIGNWVDERVTFSDRTEVNVPAAGWTGSSAPFAQTVAVSTVVATDVPSAGLVYPDNCTDAQRKSIQRSASYIYSIETGTGTITFKATIKPAVDITYSFKF